ncbi:glycosyl transferase [Streptomyces rimosus subsp. pseudoverticillatus]|uniref:ArnT family glycosyltransferase n=1 Tax=Streptomyces rimosus TaxID=1927 RepID=UPI0006B26E38|nr:glycosyltransferase family 39 protein [Streptomyces rimosus]KOT99308.1 glycosyl transferase [Streptomyces rimosus subsp. pseudoverticillatus]
MTTHDTRPPEPDATPEATPPVTPAQKIEPTPNPRRHRPALLVLLLATAALYLWDLGASGYANQFYSAAAQAGSASWKAFFFGSSDAANSITVDKPPAALWPMALSVRLFGLSAWAILVPEALMGVATVGVLYAAVRRRFGAGAGLFAGALLALTPVAALMFRFNNPDALLCLLMVCAVYCVLRALEDARTKWLLLAGVCFGFAFLTKTLQAWLILPPLTVVYAVCAPTALRRRIVQLLLGGLAMVVSGGWWVAIVELWPAASRPYIGGSQHNSFLELTFGYNGLGRINGNEAGSVGGGAPGGGRGGGGAWGDTGITRLFTSDMGGQISWLLPAAFLLLVAGLVVLRRARRTDAARAFATFSFMSGIFHQYYNVALAPYIAALVAMGATLLWQRRSRTAAALLLAGTVAVTAGWAYVLLARSPQWMPWLRWTVVAVGAVAALGLLLSVRLGRRLAVVAAGLGIAAGLGGPAAYAANTVNTPHTGSIVTAGPEVKGAGGRHGGMIVIGGRGPGPGGKGARNHGGTAGPPPGQGPGPGQGHGTRGGKDHNALGGLLNGQQVSAKAKAALKKNAADHTWAAAAIGSQNAASYQLATGLPVMPIGGFNGSDPSPTLERFKEYVRQGKIHYFIGGGMGGGFFGTKGDGSSASASTSSDITRWVEKSFKKVTIGNSTLYDLTRPAS